MQITGYLSEFSSAELLQLLEQSKKSGQSEMTGLKASPTEVTLAELRALLDWTALVEKLPDVTLGIICTAEGKPKFRLNQIEWQIWEFA